MEHRVVCRANGAPQVGLRRTSAIKSCQPAGCVNQVVRIQVSKLPNPRLRSGVPRKRTQRKVANCANLNLTGQKRKFPLPTRPFSVFYFPAAGNIFAKSTPRSSNVLRCTGVGGVTAGMVPEGPSATSFRAMVKRSASNVRKLSAAVPFSALKRLAPGRRQRLHQRDRRGPSRPGGFRIDLVEQDRASRFRMCHSAWQVSIHKKTCARTCASLYTKTVRTFSCPV